jgi:hypothetical protein
MPTPPFNVFHAKERPMNAVSYSDLRRNLKSYMDKVYQEREELIVKRRNNKGCSAPTRSVGMKFLRNFRRVRRVADKGVAEDGPARPGGAE